MKGFRVAFAVLVTVVFLLLLLGITSGVFYERHYDARPFGPTWGGMPMGPGMFWGGGMWIFPLIGLVVFLFIIYFVFTRGIGAGGPFCGWGGQSGGNSGQQSPMDVLKMRYVKGEISREEFERMKKDISESGGQ
jgi:putative membrane protein